MRAIVYTKYGPPDVLELTERQKPEPKENEVLVRVHAATVNRTDCATIRAKPFFMRLVTGLFHPKKQTPGSDFAGVIEAVGSNISSLSVGDKVFGFHDDGACSHAEYLAITQEYLLPMPANTSFEGATASIEGAHYAYNFINKVKLEAGQKVLVNGATGAIGSAAVQLLKHFGADITAVCKGEHFDLVKSLGANRLIDYTQQDFTQDTQKYRFVFDTVGKSSFFKCKKLLKPGGVYISSDLGFLAQNMYLPFITPIIKPLLDNKITIFPMPVDIKGSLQLVKKLIEQGEFKAVIDRSYPLEQIIDAYHYVETGQKTGNVVIKIAD